MKRLRHVRLADTDQPIATKIVQLLHYAFSRFVGLAVAHAVAVRPGGTHDLGVDSSNAAVTAEDRPHRKARTDRSPKNTRSSPSLTGTDGHAN
ncbi:hypothetical protein MTO96_019209 [Rhipicephalus appendiculatus]